MDNRYLYKAKRTDNREWVTGSLCDKKTYCYDNRTEPQKIIITEFSSTGYVAFEVDPSTICQCLRATDKNKNLIWEHDVVLVPGENGHFVITWSDTEMKWEMVDEENNLIVDFDNFWASEIEVIGNKIDTPILVEPDIGQEIEL